MKYLTKGIIITEIVLFLILIFWHFKLGLVRYFDADEFAHLHWGYSLSVGERPYTDFFYLFPPFFLYPIAALFKIFGRTAAVLINARMFIFFVFLATCAILFLLAKKLRNTHFALATLILFAFLPLPFDKMIEVRPDLVATFLSLVGLLLFIKGNEPFDNAPGKGDKGDGPFAFAQGKGDKGKQGKYFFFSGLSYAASMGFVPKTVFFLVPMGILLASRYLIPPPRGSTSHTPEVSLRPFLLGFLVVGLVLFLVLLSFGNVAFSLYSMTRMASEVTKVLGAKFYMRPDIFFYPNETYYGFGGWSWPLIINLIIYVSASIWAIHRLISIGSSTWKESFGHLPGVLTTSATPGVSLVEFLIAGSFFANLGAFVYFYPLKHAQYLIPVAPFIAFYFVDLLFNLFRIPSPSGESLYAGHPRGVFALVIILIVISIIGFQMNQKKLAWVNKATFAKVNYFLQTIPKSAPIYDLTGESIFFRNGYYFCCLPYGQYEEALYFRLPDLKKELDMRGTKYVYLGAYSRLNEIPARHARYIKENFTRLAADGMLWEKLTNSADRQ